LCKIFEFTYKDCNLRQLSLYSCLEEVFAGAVHIPDYYTEAPQAWFRSINATFAVSCIKKPFTKFYWALSKLPSSLVNTICSLCDDASTAADPYAKLQRIY
jgi:hypothetical protein